MSATVVATVPAAKSTAQQLPSPPSLPTVEALSSSSHPTEEALERPTVQKQPTTPMPTKQLRPTDEPALLTEFADVLNTEGRLPPSTNGVEHHIIKEGRPVTANFRLLDNTKLAAAKEEFPPLEQEGIIWRSHSRWASPLHMVQKADSSRRPCGNNRLAAEASPAVPPLCGHPHLST